MPHELTMPKVWKNRTIRIGRGILSRAKMVFFNRTNSVLLFAIKIESIIPASIQNKESSTKVREKIGLSLMNPRAGDHRSEPAIKITAKTRVTIPLRVKQEFIITTGLRVLGRKRIRASPSPSLPKVAMRETVDIIAAPKPTSTSL